MKTLQTVYQRILQFTACSLGLLLLVTSMNLKADEERLPEIDARLVRINIVEPDRDSGYTVGDLLTRTVTLEIKKPYRLLDTSLPIVGYEKRHKGQVTGIELRDIRKQQRDTADSTIHTITLTYQVFTRNVVAKPSSLPPEIVKIKGEKGIYSFRIPSWSFRISPIAVFGEVQLENDMSPFRGPMLKHDTREKLVLRIALGVLIISALGLLYILGMRAWLPRMGGPFARAYRELGKLRKLPPSDATIKLGLNSVHQAFNRTLKASVFSSNLEQFLQENPAFSSIRPEIEQFFQLSRQAFFEQLPTYQNMEVHHEWLRLFTRHCRDCERGLNPGKQA